MKNAHIVSDMPFEIMLWEERETKADVSVSPLCPPEQLGDSVVVSVLPAVADMRLCLLFNVLLQTHIQFSDMESMK